MKENQNIEFKQSWRDEYLQYIYAALQTLKVVHYI